MIYNYKNILSNITEVLAFRAVINSSNNLRLVDVHAQFEPLTLHNPSDGDCELEYLPPHLTIPGATWELAEEVRRLIIDGVRMGRLRKSDLHNGMDKDRMLELLELCYKQFLLAPLPHGSELDGEDEMKCRFFTSLSHEVLSNGVRRRDPKTGLWFGLDENGDERKLDNIDPDEIWQTATVTYGYETTDQAAYFKVHVIDVAKGWEAGRIGLNPYKIPNPIRKVSDDMKIGQSALCRRGLQMSRRYLARALKGTGYYLPVKEDMTVETLRSNEVVIRVPIPVLPSEEMESTLNRSHSIFEEKQLQK